MWLVADIGGTNARFALVDGPGAVPRDVTILPGKDYNRLAPAVNAYLAHVGCRSITALCAAVAGPVEGDHVVLTNSPWDFSIEETQQALGIQKVSIINDFHALALSLPRLPQNELLAIGGGNAMPGFAMCVVGPGTGLGTGTLLPMEGRWIAVPGEGGHVSCPAVSEKELAVFEHMRDQQGAVTAECFLCGDGLIRLYNSHAAVQGARVDVLNATHITERGLSGCDLLAVETLEMFCAMLGSVAANVALITGARGGVFLGGGILPCLPEFLLKSEFRARFDANVRMTDYLKNIPVQLIMCETPALYGAAAWLDDWQNYGSR